MRTKVTDRQALQDWQQFRENLQKSTSVDTNETEAQRIARMRRLEANPEEWFAYYFPNYYLSKPAPFHIKASKRLIANKRWYEVRAWSRELAKSTRAMMEVLYLSLTGEVKNVILVSNSSDNAERLITPFKINLESNNRIINDYGLQENLGKWEAGEFTTKGGTSFRALGAGQSPRGTRNEAIRPDFILIDDIDTDEETRNPKRIKTKWAWIEQALIPTVSVSGNIRILFCGNIIAKDCCITRAIEKADVSDVINIRDKHGKSSWPNKNSEADIDFILSKISYASAQKEYFNNPVTEGTVFKEMRWGKVPPLSKFRFLVAYGDPAPSNKENAGNCYKGVFLCGMLEGTLYVLTGFLEHVHNAKFVTWYWDLEKWAGDATQVFNFIENNTLQDPFYQQVFLPLFAEEGKRQEHYVNISGDDRKKPDKYTRIEGNLEPLNRQGRLILNEAEKKNPHMVRLEEQFKAIDPQLSCPVDGPDTIEGAYWIINQRVATTAPIKIAPRIHSNKRY